MSPLFLVPIVYLAAVLQTSLASRWEVNGATPDLLALVAFGWLTTTASPHSLIVVALIGLVGDLGSPFPLGVCMAAFALAGYCVVWLRRRLDLKGLAGQLAIVWFAATTVTLMQGAAFRAVGNAPMTWRILMEHSALVGLYTLGVSVPELMIAGWWRERHLRGVLRIEG